MATTDHLKAATESLQRIQNFNANELPRTDKLGADLNFIEAVPHAERVIGLFQQIPIQYLAELPDPNLVKIKSEADALYNLLNQALDFDAKQGDPFNTRTNLISNIRAQYEPAFEALSPIIAWASSRQRDFGALEREARAAVQAAKDRADAAKGPESRDIVLTHAAACIFAPQDTGYSKGQSQPESVANVVQTLPRIVTAQGG